MKAVRERCAFISAVEQASATVAMSGRLGAPQKVGDVARLDWPTEKSHAVIPRLRRRVTFPKNAGCL